MKERKVILFIVEGPSDKTTFSSILENYFEDSQVEVKVMFGDITTRRDVNPGNIKEKISEEIDDYCINHKYHFLDHNPQNFKKNNKETKEKSLNDIKLIIHLIDTDGLYVSDEYIKEKDVSKVEYTDSEIYTQNKEYIERRNSQKRSIVNKLNSMSSLNKTVYKVYFFSRNLEHVLYNRIDDVTDEEKQNYANEFDDKYYDDLDGFLKFIRDTEFAVPGNYRETWDFIKQEQNSLKRYSNFHLLFEK